MSAARYRIGIDLGGTKIEIVCLDEAGHERIRRRTATPRDDYRATLAAIATLIEDAERELGERASVGIGIPGSLSPHTGCVRNANSTWLNGQPLQRDLEQTLWRAVRIDNDANCFAVSEALDGAAQGLSCVFGAILGTGVGGGIVIDGKLLRGANAIAGEWGHMPLPAASGRPWRERPGPRCWCGRRGCVETWLSGPAWLADYRRHADRGRDQSALRGRDPAALGGARPAAPHRAPSSAAPPTDARAIVAAMRRGDTEAIAAFDRYADRLARALAVVIDLIDPDAIVLGGGLSGIDELYQAVPARWSAAVFADRIDTRLLKNRHGDSSGVRGAARLWP